MQYSKLNQHRFRGYGKYGHAILGLMIIGIVAACSAAQSRSMPSTSSRDYSSSPSYEYHGPERKSDASYDRQIRSGTLTAGAVDDIHDYAGYREFQAKASRDRWDVPYQLRPTDRQLIVTLRDRKGRPIPNAKLTFAELDDQVWISGPDGRIIMTDRWDDLPEQRLTALISRENQGKIHRIPCFINTNTTELNLNLEAEMPRRINQVEITFVLDTTGSMSDELEYLKVELRDIAKRVHQSYPGVDQRYALVAYRDHGDDYVTRSYDFTNHLNDFIRSLGKQSADGGGDYPEALDEAMDRADAFHWTRRNTVRLVFMIADAPPHDHDVKNYIKQVEHLRRKGVRIYPVAASGTNHKAQFLFRQAAHITGGRYLFLTDDSGVGHAHDEPRDANYDVMKLKDMLVKVIESNIAGEEREVQDYKVIRKVRDEAAPSRDQGKHRQPRYRDQW